jgi:hypothetical protein
MVTGVACVLICVAVVLIVLNVPPSTKFWIPAVETASEPEPCLTRPDIPFTFKVGGLMTIALVLVARLPWLAGVVFGKDTE